MAKTKKTSSSRKLVLETKPRSVFGKKLKKLRKEGLLPANVFGTDFKSQSLSLNIKDFVNTYREARETGIVYLKIGSDEIPVLIRNVQKHPVNDNYLHIDFRKVDLKKKIATAVPVKILGTSEAVAQKNGVLLTLSENLIVEALPQDIPSQIDVDVSVLKEIGQEIKVVNLKKSDKYEIKDELNKVIISVVEHKEESITPETTAAATPEVITEAVVPEGEEEPAKEAPKEEINKEAKPKSTPEQKKPEVKK